MENNAIQIEITAQDENNGVLTSMHKELDSLNISFNEKWCIYKVPEYVLKGHEYFYQPLVMSIGPVFYKNPKLEPMQKVKWICLNSFLQHPKNASQSLNPYIEFVRNKEEEIRKCYEQEFEFCSDEFVKMIVLDAAFLVYYFLSETMPLEFDNIKAPLSNGVLSDLLKFENQIPYFVLRGIFHIAFGHISEPYIYNTLIHCTLGFIGISRFPGFKAIKSIIEGDKITDESSIQHILDLQWMSCCLFFSNQISADSSSSSISYISKIIKYCRSCCFYLNLLSRVQRRRICLPDERICNPTYPRTANPTYPRTAKKLSDNGVKFEVSGSDSPFQITFKKGKFMIPELVLDNDTEPYLRNLQHFELCHYYSKNTYINDYVLFFDKLIDTVEDVQVLQEAGILINNLGSDKHAIRFFNNVPKNPVGHHFHYSKVSEDANAFANKSWNQWKALLRRRYFGHPWAAISVIAAIILFILTLLQTIAAFTM